MKDDGWVRSGLELSASHPDEASPAKRPKRKTKAMPSTPTARVEFMDGIYKIVACHWQGQYVANAHAGRRRIEQVTGDSIDAALAELKRLLQQRKLNFQACRKGGVPCADEYRDALENYGANLSEPLRSALRGHAARPDRTASIRALSVRLHTSPKELERGYAKLGSAISKGLSFRLSAADFSARSILSFATVAEGTHPGAGDWTLRPEFAEALHSFLTH